MHHTTLYRLQRYFWSALTIAFMSISVMHAQSDAGAGALRGAVSSPDGKAVTNAMVIVRNAETGYVREALSDNVGRFDVKALPVGLYFVQASLGS